MASQKNNTKELQDSRDTDLWELSSELAEADKANDMKTMAEILRKIKKYKLSKADIFHYDLAEFIEFLI